MAILRKSALSTLPALPQLSEALERAEQRLADWLLDPQRVQALLAQVFPSPPTPAWHGLRETLLAGRLQLDLQIREDWEMPGLAGAFQAPAPSRPQGLILLNRRWLASATAAAVEAVLLEELGHAIDRQLHGAVDSAGDEGERFSTLLRGQQPSLTSQREDDSRELLISGQRIRVEGSGNAAVALPSVSLALTTPAGATAPQRTAFGGSTIRLDANLSLGSLTGSPTRMLVHFARGYVAGEDELVVVGSLPAAIRASFDKTRGILNLVAVSGQTPSQTDWRDALRAVAYRNLNSSATPARVPTAGDRELVITTGELPALFINNQAHFYRFESAPAPGAGSNAWLRARDAAAASTYGSLSGYLATITSADENAFITRALLPVEGRTWLGGSDAGTEGKWSWDAGSASPESSTATFSQTVSGSLTSKAVGSLYVNWEANQGTGKDEDHLSIASTGRWSDDDGANFSTKDYGYLVEYSPATGTPDSTRRLVVRPLPAVADQTFTVADYGSQAIQGTTYTLTNANLDLLLFGGEKLTIQASSVTISNGKIVSLKGSGTATSLYGLSDVNLSAITINASSRSITGKAKIGDQEINLSGSLKLESNGRYSFADLTGSISNEALTKLLPEGGYLSQATGGGYSFRKDTAGTSLELAIKGVASFDPRPDLADVSTPFTVRIANGVFSNGKLSAMDLQRQGTTPWKLMLADHELTVNSETITYKRDQQAPSLNSNTPTLVKHLYSLDLAGDLKQTEGDILKLDGVLTLASAVSGSGAPLQQPMAASFDILNNQIFRVGDTRLKANGGLKLNYQEDASRRFGMLALAGDAKIDLEIFKDLDIKLGEDNQNLPALLNSQADKLMATEWTLGRVASVPAASRRDLGLLSYGHIEILPMVTQPLIYEGSVEQPAVSTQQQQDLLDALEPTLGLYRVANLDAKIITDTFTLKGVDGRPVATVTLDILPSDSAGTPAIKRTQSLNLSDMKSLYDWMEAQKGDVADFSALWSDAYATKDLSDKIAEISDWFKSETVTTDKGSISVKSNGEWVYTVNPATADRLGGKYVVKPRLSAGTSLMAIVDQPSLDLKTLLLGAGEYANQSLVANKSTINFLNGLEYEIPLTKSEAFNGVLLKLFESTPYNAYRDGKLQVIEIIDTLLYGIIKYMAATKQWKVKGVEVTPYIPLTPGLKALSYWVRTSTAIVKITQSNKTGPELSKFIMDNGLFRGSKSPDPWNPEKVILSLDYNAAEPTAADDWLRQAVAFTTDDVSTFSESATKRLTNPGALSRSWDRSNSTSKTNPVANNNSQPRKHPFERGQSGVSAGASFGFNVDFTFPALYDPDKFVLNFIAGDQVVLNTFDLDLSLGLDASIRFQIFPLIAVLLGLNISFEWALNWVSMLTQDEINTLGENILRIEANANLSVAEKNSEVVSLLNSKFNQSYTDLSKQKFQISITPSLALELGIPLLNITGKIALSSIFKYTKERWVDGFKSPNQIVNLNDYEGTPASKRYDYMPKLESLTFNLEHVYDFLLKQGPSDKTGYETFKQAYAENSWLFNIYIDPINLRSLIGTSKLSYDISLLKKLGDADISKIAWVNFVDPSIVTSGGIEFLFKEAKQLNSGISKAFRSALQKQYPKLTEKEVSRLLTLIIDNGIPTKVDYALADSQNISARIEEMKRTYTITGSRGLNENAVLDTDRFRYRFDTADAQNAVDNYSYYSLATPKTVTINPKLDNYNYISVEFDIISTANQLDAEIQFFDGTSWQKLGRVNDSLLRNSDEKNSRAAIAFDTTAPSIDLRFIEDKDAKWPADMSKYVHNSGVLSVRLSLAHMDGAASSPLEQALLDRARSGKLQLRLQDNTTGGSLQDTTYMSDPRILRGGAIYSKSSDPSTALRQDKPLSWLSHLDSGTVAWLAPTFFRPLSDRSDLAGLTGSASQRSEAIAARLNPDLPVSVHMGVQRFQMASTDHISNVQSGALAEGVQGSVRFTKDPISQITYKSYIGSDRRVRVAARLADSSDWVDIATIDNDSTATGNLNLSATETTAPDLVAVNEEIMLTSWDSAGHLLTFTLTKSADTQRYSVKASTVDAVTLDRQVSSGFEVTNRLSSSDQSNRFTNANLRIGLEKRLDLLSATSLQQAFYVSVLDPVEQVYGTTAKPLSLAISDYDAVANTESLGNLGEAWLNKDVSQALLKSQLKSLLGFGEYSNSGTFSPTGIAMTGEVGTIKAADFIEYPSADSLSKHLLEWGSGSVFVAAANANGEAMLWNYDGEGYYAKNRNRSAKEITTSSGRVYSVNGLIPSSLSVVYKPLDQKDSLASNWQGLVDEKSALYSQVANQPIRTATNPGSDNLIAGANVSILAVGTAQDFALYHQTAGTAAAIGSLDANAYQYKDGDLIARYISPQRFTGSDGVNYWYDASNVAPLKVETLTAETADPLRKATAALNTLGNAGGLGWVWTPANQNSNKSLTELNLTTGLDFLDTNSLNLALTSQAALGPADQSLRLIPNSLQLLPTDLTPELFMDLSDGTKVLDRVSAKASSLSEMGVVLPGSELLNPSRLSTDQKLTSFEIIRSQFDGSRPFLTRGDYVPFGVFRQDGKLFYGNINAPVEITQASLDIQSLFKTSRPNYAVVPLGFEGTVADLVTYGVDQGSGDEIQKLISRMPTVVPDNYFRFADHAGSTVDIGDVIHVPMVPLRATGSNQDSSKQLIFPDLTPWTAAETNQLYLAGSTPIDVSLGRGEPDPVVLEKLNLYSTYIKGNQTLEGFVNYAWNDPQLKFDLLDKAYPVSSFDSPAKWLAEFGTRYGGFNLPTGYTFIGGDSPDLVNSTLFTPISASADTGVNLDLSGKPPASNDIIRGKWTYETALTLSAELTALIFTIPIVSKTWSLHKPVVWWKDSYGARRTVSGGPLVGSFDVYIDEDRDLSRDPAEAYSSGPSQSVTLDLSGAAERLLLDTSAISNTVWDGTNYIVRYQDNRLDYRSGLLISKPTTAGSVVDVMTGLASRTTYISRLEKNVVDTHWETIKNSPLLDYIPHSFKDIATIPTGRWFSDRLALTKLVPEEIANVFTQTFLLPSGLDADLSNPTNIYQGFIAAVSAPQPNLLAQYKFETQMMVMSSLIRQLYGKLKVNTSQLSTSNAAAGYDPDIYANQVIPYLAFTLAGKTHADYKKLVELLCDSIGGTRAAQIKAGLAKPGTVKLDFSQPADIALALGFAQTTLPQTDFFASDWSNGRLKLTASNSIKTALQQMRLLEVGTTLSQYLKAWDTIATSQYAANSLLVTTAVSEIKREILKDGGVLSKAVDGIINKKSAGISAPTPWQTFKPLDPSTFVLRNQQIQAEASLTKVSPGVAGLAKAQVVNQVFGDSDSGVYEFTLRLSRPAPNGGAVLLLAYEGSAVYGTDYTINGLSSRPQYLYVPGGEITQTVKIDTSKSKNPSSLLLQLASSSADYSISSAFNRMLFEIGNGKATIFEQKDNVRLLAGAKDQLTPTGETIFAVLPADTSTSVQQQPMLIGSQPSLAEPYVNISRYASVLYPDIIQYSATIPQDSEITGGWTLLAKDLFRAYAGDRGAVDVVELKNTSTGIYTYTSEQARISQLTSQGWVSNGVAFSLDYDRSLPLSIKTARGAAPVGTVPGMSLAGITGYLDTYTFAPNQDISEWRFVASAKNLSLKNLFSSAVTLNGDLMLRKRHEYTTDTFWFSAAASGFVLPSLATGPAAKANTAAGQLDLRISQESGKSAAVDQWRIQTIVSDYQFTDSLKLSGSLDLAYERSASTNFKSRYALAASVKNFSFSDGGINLSNLDVNVKKLILEEGQLMNLNLDASVTDLQIAGQFKVSGKISVDYSKTAKATSLVGSAEISSFSLGLGGSASFSVGKGDIDFSIINGDLTSASLSITAAQITANQFFNIQLASGSIDLTRENGALKSLEAKATVSSSVVGPLSITSADLFLKYDRIAAVPVKNGNPLPARDETTIAVSNLSGSFSLLSPPGQGTPSTTKGVLSMSNGSANLNIIDGQLSSYDLKTGEVSLQLGEGINLTGGLSLKKETIKENNQNVDKVYLAMYATSLAIDVAGFKLNGDGEVEATISNQQLSMLSIDANIDQMSYAGFQLGGFAKLQLNDADNNGSLETIKLSAGIDDFKISLPGNSSNASLYGEIQDLVVVDGDVQSWTLIGGVNDFGIADLFTANGFASLSYTKTVNNAIVKERFVGSLGISNFTLSLPGNSPDELSIGSARGLLDFDWYDNALHQWKLSADVTDLKLATGIKISGSVSLEYRDADYSTNSYGSNLYLLDATLKEAEIRLKSDQAPVKLSGGLKNLALTDDGTIHSWTLSASVKNLNLFSGFEISGSLNLDYKRTSSGTNITETYKGSAEISGFTLPMAGLSTDPGTSLSGKLSFTSVNGELEAWTLSAKASNLRILDAFQLNGEVELSASLATNPNQFTVKATIQELTLNVANKFTAKMAGQLNLSYKTIDGAVTAEEWTLKATTLEMSVPNTLSTMGGNLFNIKGQAEVYRKKNDSDDDLTVSARVDQFSLMLPGNGSVPAMNLSGELSASFDNGKLKTLKINSKVQNLRIKDFSLDGGFELSYQSASPTAYFAGEDVYKLHAEFNQLKLDAPGGLANSLNLGSGSVDLTYGSISGITAWDLRAKISNLKLFNAVTLSGSVGISYTKTIVRVDNLDIPRETFDFAATVTDLTLNTLNSENLRLAGSFKMRSVDGTMDAWSLAASANGLQLVGLNLNGQFDLAYSRQDSTYFDAETIRLSRASVNLSGGIGSFFKDVQAGLVISDVLVSRHPRAANEWTTIKWKAQANLDISGDDRPFILKANLNIAYLKYNPVYNNAGTYSLAGGINEFRLNTNLVSVKDARLNIRDLVILEDAADPLQSITVEGFIQELNILNILRLSGDFLINYINDAKKSVSITGSLTDLDLAGFDIFDSLGIDSSSIMVNYSGDGSLSADFTIKLAPNSNLNLGLFSLGLGGSDLTLTYRKPAGNSSGSLGLTGNGRMTLGSTAIAVEGGFAASINLDTGTPSLDSLSLNLTPDNNPVSFGILELQAPTSILYTKNAQNQGIITLSAEPRINQRFFNQIASPIYDLIDTLSPALSPAIDFLTYEIPNDISTQEVSLTIPALKIPSLEFTGWKRGLFGIKFPTFDTVWKEITPEIKTVLVPGIDIGTPLTNLLENYPGNPFIDQEIQVIEIIDGLGATAFYTAQKLAQVFLGDALEPYIGAFGDLAYTMDYPAISPMVAIIKDLLELAEEGKKSAGNEWLSLPRVDLNYNISTNDVSVSGSGGDLGPFNSIVDNIGVIGSLYKTLNRNNPIPSGSAPPKEETGASAQLGFANNSGMRVPIFENPAKAIFDFILDKPFDLFEFNLDLTGSVAARASVDFSPFIAAATGVPVPLILGGNASLSANLDATVGFTASPKAIKDIAASVYNIFTNNGSFENIFNAIVAGVTEPNRGVYLDISKDILTLRPSASVDLSLDWKAIGVRAQIGLATTLSAALKLLSQPPKVINVQAYDADTNDAGSSPTSEVASKAFDGNTNSKYLNSGGKNSGFRFNLDKPANFTSFTIVTGNDAPGRDPASFTIRAKNDDSNAWVTLAANQPINLPLGRKSESAAIGFANSNYYTQYEVIFPTLRSDPSTAMQLSEFRFAPKMNSQQASQDRLYLTNLIMPLFDPNFKDGKQANDLYLSLKPGATTLWVDVLAKLASPWFSILRLEAGTDGVALKVFGQTVGKTPPLPLPQISLDIPLGIVYTGPTHGPTAVVFGDDILIDVAAADADVLTDFRSGFADQKGLFDRIANELATDQPNGFLTVLTSEYSRDVLTSIPRSLLLFDHISQQDSTPDALNVITSLGSTSGLLATHSTTTAATTATKILEKIVGYSDVFAGSESSYALLGGSTSAEQEQGRDKLIFEYRLQTVLLAIQDQLRSSNGKTSSTLQLNGFDTNLPASEALWPYILLNQYLASLATGITVDFTNADSLKGLFAWVESTLATTGSTSGLVTAGLMADFVRSLCISIGEIAQQAEAVEGSGLLAPIALSGLKQVIQSHALEGYIRNLRAFAGSEPQLKQRLEQLNASFASLTLLPRSSSTPDRFTDIGWFVENGNSMSLQLKNASNELGAFVNLWIDSALVYGKDYRIKGYSSQPLQLVISPNGDRLDIEIEILNNSLSGAQLDLRLLASPAGVEIDVTRRVLRVSLTGSTVSADVVSNDSDPLPVNALTAIQADSAGLFTLTSTLAEPYLLTGFDPILGHRIKSEVATISSDDLQIINGLLYCGNKAIGVVLSSTITGHDLLSYSNQLAPISSPDPDAGALWRAAPQSIQEDSIASLDLSTLLAGFDLSPQAQVVHVAATARLQASLSGAQIRIIPDPDYSGSAALVLSIADAGKLATLVVPLNVIGSADGARLLQPIRLEMNEDGELIVPEALLTGSVIDRDRFGEVGLIDLISSTSNSGTFVVSRNTVDQTLTIKPSADINGTFSFDLKVQTVSGPVTLDQAVSLTVKPVDDLPEARGISLMDLTSKGFVRIRDSVIPNGNPESPQDRTFGLIDGDGDPISGIRITSYPVTGDLRWQPAPPANLDSMGEGAAAFDLVTHGMISLDDIERGRLIYIPDNVNPLANRPSDLFSFVIVQERDGKRIESAPFNFSVGDTLEDDDTAVRPAIVSSTIDYSKQTDLATITLNFDQPLSLEGGKMRLWLKDPAKPDATPQLLGAFDLHSSQLSLDRKRLIVEDFKVPDNIEGTLSFDFTSQANVLRTDNGISLSSDPQQFSLIVDTLPVKLLSHSFSVKESSILLDLEFSNPMLSTGNARLSYFNPITGQTSEITSLRPSTTPIREGVPAYASSTVTFDFGSLVNNLTVIPGQTYKLSLDADTGLKDPGDNSTNSAVVSLDLKIPYPKTPAFSAAETNDKGITVSPTTFYFTVENGITEKDQVPIVTPTARLPQGVQVQAAAYNSSRLFFKLETAGIYNLGINLVGQNAQEISVHELEILYPRKELWFDPDLLEKIGAIKSFSLDRDPANDSFGILKLRLNGSGKLNLGSSELLNIPFRTFPLSNGANQRDTAPPIILRKVVGIQAGAVIKTSELNLPQLLLNKDNLALVTEPIIALGDRTLTINANSAGDGADLIIRSLRGLKSGGAISLVSAPSKGVVTIDQNKEVWIYKPHENEVGEDKFSLRVVDSEGNQIDHNVVITIRPNAVKHAVITAEDEMQLAARLSPNASGDSNGDNKPDVEQGNMAILPWGSINNFSDPDNASTSSLIRLLVPKDSEQVNSTGEALTSPNLNDSWEFSQIEVLSLADPSFGGGMPAGVVGSWDPLSFSLSTVAGAANTSQTVRVWIDLSSGQYPSSYFNSYRKFVSDSAIQDYIAAGLPLKDLDGGAITKPGWYDFMQRTDANGNPVGDGARMITKNGFIQGIELNLRDNSFGDSDPSVGLIRDPGSLGLVPQIRLNPGQLSPALSTATTSHGLPELQFIASPGLAPQFKVFAPGANVGTSGLLSGTSLVVGQQFRVEEITIDADRSAYVLRFLDASPSRPGHQVFGSRFQGLPTGNDAAVADGVYRITLADNIQLGSFSLATQQLATAQQLRLARFNTLAVQKNNYYYFAPLHGYRNAATPGDGDDFLLGKAIANVGLSRDLLSGMGGNDFLNGYGNRFDPSLDFNATTNPLSAFGRNQRDVLTGGAGRDVFQLADAIGVFYRGDAAQGFAQITDFSAEDVLILSGSPAQYTLTAPLTAQQSPVGIAGRALYAGDPKTGGDLIAVLQGVGSAAFQLGSAANPSSQVHWL